MIKLTAKKGYKYLNIKNNVVAGEVCLGINESVDNWKEITEEEAAVIIKEQKRKEYAEHLKESLTYLYEQQMSVYIDEEDKDGDKDRQ